MLVRFKRVDEKPVDELTVFGIVYDKYERVELKNCFWHCYNAINNLPDFSFELDAKDNCVVVSVRTYKNASIVKELFAKAGLIPVASKI